MVNLVALNLIIIMAGCVTVFPIHSPTARSAQSYGVFDGRRSLSVVRRDPKIYLLAVLASLFLSVCSPSALAQSNVPHFKDYPAGELYKGPTVPLVLARDDVTFKTRLRWAAKNQKPNFAGHYILTSWGCGAQCVMGAVIDAKTGKVYWWNFSICCWGSDTDDKFNPIEFRPDSRLIVFSGLRNEKDGDDGAHFYRFDDGRFVHIRSVLKPSQ